MSGVKIEKSAIERNKAWIDGVTYALNKMGNEGICRCIMKSAGRECASQLLEKTINHFGKDPHSVAEIIEAINKRRKEVLKSDAFWELKGNQARLILDKCGCDLVEEGLAKTNPTFCLCSEGMFESIFVPYHNGTVRVQLMKAIGKGDDHCEFVVHFE